MRLPSLFVAIVLAIETSGQLNGIAKKRCEQFISVFENDSIDIQYDYVENIGDGRGYTCGKFGFTTATGDAYELIKRYTQKNKNNPLAKYLPELKKLAEKFSKDTSKLQGFPDAWHKACKDPVFIQVQDEVSAEGSYDPAMKYADKAGVKSALGRCALYDCIIEHGEGDDGDSMNSILDRTIAKEKGGVKDDEKKWIRAFLDMRLDDFDHPRDQINKKHHKGWHDDSVERVYAMIDLLNQGNMDLHGPIHIKTDNHDKIIP